MKNLLNSFLRIWVKIALHLYFRKITVVGKENIPKGKPVILVANHQNALIDPLLLATHTQLKPWFLTRASAFKNSFVSKLLNLIRMLPVYRIRDGFSSIAQNEQIFAQTISILAQNGSVIIFAEGNHSLNRNLRPLSKGFTRMALGLLEKFPKKEPVILPVAIEYSAHKHPGSRVKITFGPTISVLADTHPGKLTRQVQQNLGAMLVTIPDDSYEKDLERLIENGIDLTDRMAVSDFLTHGEAKSKLPFYSGMRKKVMNLVHFPLFLIWLAISPKIEDRVFESTFKFLIGFALGPLFYLLLILGVFYSSEPSWFLTWLILGIFSIFWNKSPQE